MKKVVFCFFASVLLNAQSIDISKFYYRDYLDFGQGYGAFNGENSGKANTSNSTTLTDKDGTKVSVPNVPNFSASSNYGSLTSVGRGFAVTANHVSSPTGADGLLRWGLTDYKIAEQENGDVGGISKPYGRDEKFIRLDKYVVEGQVDMLDTPNSLVSTNATQEQENINKFKTELKNFKDENGNIYIYQAGSGIVSLRGTSSEQGFNTNGSGEMKGGGFGTLGESNIQYGCLVQTQSCDSHGIWFYYHPNGDFNNRITSGDSGSGIYAYNTTKKEWVLLGVTSRATSGVNRAEISFISNKDLEDYRKSFEQKIALTTNQNYTINNQGLNDESFQGNKDIIFSGGGNIQVTNNIYRNVSGQAGGFVFTATNSATKDNPTKYIFTNKYDKANIFAGSGLDIEQNVVVEWALRNQSGDSLHKIGKGELIVKTNYTPTSNENLGTLKIGEGKVTLDTNKKAFENIYITSGRGELALVKDRAEALGAEKNGANSVSGTTSANSYTLSQDKNSEMGFYFGKGGGKFDLAGNSLVLNTIAANDSKAIITNSDTSLVNLEIQGFGYDTDGKKDSTQKADTIIHASIGETPTAQNPNGTAANLNLIYKGDKTPTTRHSERSEESIGTNSVDSSLSAKAQNDSTASNTTQTSGLPRVASNARNDDSASDSIPSLRANEVSAAIQESSKAHLIFDGNINTSGKMEVTNGNIALQGHATTHATISNADTIDKIKKAESGTSQKMPDYMDLSKPSNLQQPDWDSRNFNIKKGINLTNATLTVGKAANLTADITADKDSQINFGGRHFIDSKDGKNVIGSGFSYQQGVTSDELKDESYKDSSYNGTITASGTKITSQFFDFAPNLELSNNASLNAKFLTINSKTNTLKFDKSNANIETLKIVDIKDTLNGKISLLNNSKFSVSKGLSFDNSTFNLDTLSTNLNSIEIPTNYDLSMLNNSNITATTFTNSNANAEFMLDGKSTFNATNGVSFKSAKISVQNEAEFKADSLKFDTKSTIDLDKGKFTLTNGLQTQDLNLNLLNSSTLNAKSLTSKGASTINLNDKAELTITDILTSENLTLTLENESKFIAKTLTASGVVNLQGDKNATLTLDTLNLNGANTANLGGVTSTIGTLNLTQKSQANIGENVSITTLNLSGSTANLQNLKTNLPQSITLNKQSTLQLNELNLNTNSIQLTSDDSSKAHIKKLIYDTTKAQANGANKTPQSNLSVSELFKLDNVGTNLGTTTGAQGTEQEKLEKDLFALEFSKKLELKDGANLDISFAEAVKKDNTNLLFDKDYKIFSASTLTGSNLNINFKNFNGASFNETNFFATGKLENNAFFVQFVRENPRNFGNLNPHIKNPAHSPLLEILLQHNKNDTSIDKAVNMSDYTALNQRLAQIDTSLKTIANADSAALKTLPLLQKQEINARIQQNRFTTAKFALAKITNPAQKSDIVPTLLYLDENERQNRVWSGASASFFSNDSDKFSLQSVSIGYDRKLFGDEFLLGILASLTNTQLSSDETSLNPKIYTLALYSDALFKHGELQNELSFSLLNGDKGFESENGSYKSFYGFFESVYKVQTAFLPQSIKPIVLGRVNLRHFDEFSTATYKQKADDDISVDLGVGVEWLWQKESGFYSASFVAERDIYHSQKERLMSLTGAQKFVAYETNEPSFAYQLYLAGLENFKNGIYLRYGLSGFVDSKAYKGFKADVQVGYKF